MLARLPKTLLNGRLRTSTLLLSALFVGVLTLYLGVRPEPVAGPGSPAGHGVVRHRPRRR